MTTLDDLPRTTAQSRHQEEDPRLQAGLRIARIAITATAAGMTKAKLIAGMADAPTWYPRPTSSAPRTEWESTWINWTVSQTVELKEIETLANAAGADTKVDSAVLDIMSMADGLAVELANVSGVAVAGRARWVARWLTWRGQELLIYAEAADLAQGYIDARIAGRDPRDIAEEFVPTLLQSALLGIKTPENLHPTMAGAWRHSEMRARLVLMRALLDVLPSVEYQVLALSVG